jgi:hypothetical protein
MHVHVDHPQRRNLKLAVAICSTGGVFQMELTGSDYPGCPAFPPYLDSKGRQLISMGGEEYLHVINAAWQHFSENREFRARRKTALLVHDRGKAHMSAVVMHGLQQLGLRAVAMPPRSPDLMPLDYGIFGTCKLQLERSMPRNAAWGDRVGRFKELIAAAAVKPTIGQFEQRLDAALRAGGGHIDQSLKEVRNG